MAKKNQGDGTSALNDMAAVDVPVDATPHVEPVAHAQVHADPVQPKPVRVSSPRGDDMAELVAALKDLITYAAGVGPSTAPALTKARAILSKHGG